MQQNCLLDFARSGYASILRQRLDGSGRQISTVKQSKRQRLGQEWIGSRGLQGLRVRRVDGIFEKACGLIS